MIVNRFFLIRFLGIVVFFSAGCKKSSVKPETVADVKNEEVKKAGVDVGSVSELGATSLVYNGRVANTGNGKVSSRGLCISTSPDPTIEQSKLDPSSITSSGEFKVTVSNLTASTTYYIRAYAINEAGVSYSLQLEIKTLPVPNPTVEVTPMFIIGATVASVDVVIKDDGGVTISERGICYGASPNPAVEDGKIVSGSGVSSFRANLKSLTEKTTYYLRVYTVRAGLVSYSENVSFTTIPKGNLTYTLNKAPNPSPEEAAAWDRLKFAVDSAVWYFNNYTSLTKHVWINYSPGTPTADANNEGWMNFGTNPGFQNMRTMFHELNHTFGTGTTDFWWSTVINGRYTKPKAQAMMRMILKDPNANLWGDGQHWWPFGLNQNSEVSSSWDYVYNCLIIEAMRLDGLPAAGAVNY